MNLGEIATKQDIEAMKQELLQALAALAKKQDTELQKEWLRSKEVRKMLGDISSGTLANLRAKGLLKPSKIDGIYLYKLSEVKELLNGGRG